MLWLVAALWVPVLVALLLGVLAGWWFWARPLDRAAREQAAGELAAGERDGAGGR